MNKKIELAKSWFVLAQLFMILAGFLFATAGIAWQTSTNLLNTANQNNQAMLNAFYMSNITGFIGLPLKNYIDTQSNLTRLWANLAE